MITSATVDVRNQLVHAMPVVERRDDIAGIPTAVLEGGDGPPVVLLHGPASHAASFLRAIPGLVARHRVIAPDLPGHGASGTGDRPLDVDRVLAWLDGLVERTCASPPALVGHMLGGAIAARYASRHGARVRSLVLVSALGLRPFEPTARLGKAVHDYFADPTDRTHQELWSSCVHDVERLRAEMGASWAPFERYNLEQVRTHGAAVEALMGAFGIPAIPEDVLARIDVPTTLIWGRHDPATPLAVAEGASKRHGWPLHVIEGAGDDPLLEQPAEAVRVLLEAVQV